MTTQVETQQRVLADFRDAEVVRSWQAINDNVMGGLSTGRIAPTSSGAAAFRGNLSREKLGGFCSVRTPFADWHLEGWAGLALRVRGDGRRYRLFVKTDDADDGRYHQAAICPPAGRWSTVRVPFDEMKATFRGVRALLHPHLRPRKVRAIGLLVADGQEGAFRLEIESVGAYARD